LTQVSQGCGPEAISAVIAAPLPTILTNPAQVVDPTVSRADRMAVASLVLGILSVSSYCLIIWLILNYACSILAIVFGIKGRRGSRKGIASAGLVFGIIGLAIAIGIHVLVVMEALGYRDIPGLDITLPF
jgi:O-antigen ligase